MFWSLKFLSINSIKVRSWPNPYKVGTHLTHLKRWNKSHQTILSFSWFFDRESRWYKVTFSFPSWRSLNFWKGHLTIPKSSPRIARYMLFLNCSWLVHDKLTIFSAALASGRANLFNRMRRDSFSSSCQTRGKMTGYKKCWESSGIGDDFPPSLRLHGWVWGVEYHLLSGDYWISRIPHKKKKTPNTPRVAVLLLEGVAHFHHLRLQGLHKNIYEWSILAAAGAATTTTTTTPTPTMPPTMTTTLPLRDYH